MPTTNNNLDGILNEILERNDEQSKNILIASSWLAAEKTLPHDLISKVIDVQADTLTQKFAYLESKELLDRTGSGYSMPSKVVRIIRDKVDNKQLRSILLKTCKEMYELTKSLENPKDFEPYAVHIEKLAQSGQIHKIPVSGLLFGLLGRYMFKIGDPEEAVRFIKRALLIVEKSSGVESVEHTENINNLGIALHRMGRFEDAKKCFEQAIIIDTEILGEEDQAVATGHNNLGQVLIDMNNLDGAIIHLEKALKINIKNYGDDHPVVASGNYNLGMALLTKGDLNLAKSHLEKALTKREKNLEDNHSEIADAHHGLGMVLQMSGDVNGAKEQYFKAIEILELETNEQDPKLAASYANLGGLFHVERDMKKAKELYEKAMDTFSMSPYDKDQSIKDLKLQLKLIDFDLTMPELLMKLEAGEPLPDELVKILEESFGSVKN